MSVNIIVNAPCEEYKGQYVTIPSLTANTTIISHGVDPAKVIEEAEIKGYKEPVIVYIPKEGDSYFF